MNQTGGVDPGIAALVAALLSGGIGAYGYKKDTRTAEQVAAERLEGKYKTELADATRKAKEASGIIATSEGNVKKIRALEAELAELKKKYESLRSSSEGVSEYDRIFRSANPDALKAAIPITITKLSAKFPWIQPDSTPALKEALTYPTTYMGRLARMGLYDFYQKRVRKALEQDKSPKKGGTDDAEAAAPEAAAEPAEAAAEPAEAAAPEAAAEPAEAAAAPEDGHDDVVASLEAAVAGVPEAVPPEAIAPVVAPVVAPEAAPEAVAPGIPTYEEFAKEYASAITEATASLPTIRQKEDSRLAEANDARAARAAKTAAETLAQKISAVVDTAKRELEKVPNDSPEKAELVVAVDEGDKIIASLRDTSPDPVTSWNTKRPEAEKVLADIPRLTDALRMTMGLALQSNPLVAIQEEREKQKELREELGRRGKEARAEQEAKVMSEVSPKPKTRRKERFGGKVRKRTLKKRRGGK